MSMDYYDRQGNPISFEEFIALDTEKYRRVNLTFLDKHRISTVWVGLDMNCGVGKKLIFETMVFPPNSWEDLFCRRYETEEEARIGHIKAIYMVCLGCVK